MATSFTADDAQAQIAALRKQVNQLMGEHVTPALSDAADRAQAVAQPGARLHARAGGRRGRAGARPSADRDRARRRGGLRARPLRPLTRVRTVDLGRTAAQAELLRIKRLIRRQVMRAVWGAVAAVFADRRAGDGPRGGLFALVPLAVAPIWAAVVVLAFDLIVLLIFGLMARAAQPDGSRPRPRACATRPWSRCGRAWRSRSAQPGEPAARSRGAEERGA